MTSLRADEFNVDMRGYHSHDMVIPDFIIQSAGSSDGGWHNIVVDCDSDEDVLECVTYLTNKRSRPILANSADD